MASVNGTISLRNVRLSEDNQNLWEALKGQYGQSGEEHASFTIIKNVLFVHLYNGAKYNNVRLPFQVYDGFIQCNDGTIIQVKDSVLNCELDSETNGFGSFVLKKWN